MLPDRVSNPGPLTYESGVLPIALRSLATSYLHCMLSYYVVTSKDHDENVFCTFQFGSILSNF